MTQYADPHSPARRHAPPKAAPMLEALRGLGYLPATAVADLIDNSISADATEICVDFVWDSEGSPPINATRISIRDNGRGMSPDALDSAMRLGFRDPLSERAVGDLGRFGLGLKTASLSQCRRLTVASSDGNRVTCLRWDLDEVARSVDDGWYLLEGPDPSSSHLIPSWSPGDTGTFVLWERLDRIVTPPYSPQNFLDMIDAVEAHLRMVFHRFLQGPRPRLSVLLNGRPIAPWDPFLTGHLAKPWHSPLVPLPTPNGVIKVECHVLPHKDYLSPQEFESAGGPDGWTAQQGFYVYRGERLLVAGSWLGLGAGRLWTKEESHKLARIRLDLPNTADAPWKLDIRKSLARPPADLRPWLQKFAEDTRRRAREVFAFRGKPVQRTHRPDFQFAWLPIESRSRTTYRLNRSHPAIASVLDLAGFLVPEITAMLQVIEETVPIQRIWLDTAEGRDIPPTGFGPSPPDGVASILTVLYRDLVVRSGLSPSTARDRLSATEPFQLYPDLIAALPDDPAGSDEGVDS